MKKSAISGLAGMIMIAASPSIWAGNDRAEMLAAQNAGLSIGQAVTLLEEKYQAVAVEIEVDGWRDGFAYDVELYDSEKGLEIDVKADMDTGEILMEERKHVASWVREKDDDEEHQAVLALRENNFSLTQAIDMILQRGQGTIYEVELEYKRGAAVVEVKMVSSTGKQKAIVDVDTGAVSFR